MVADSLAGLFDERGGLPFLVVVKQLCKLFRGELCLSALHGGDERDRDGRNSATSFWLSSFATRNAFMLTILTLFLVFSIKVLPLQSS